MGMLFYAQKNKHWARKMLFMLHFAFVFYYDQTPYLYGVLFC
jgi:hypothetical protein